MIALTLYRIFSVHRFCLLPTGLRCKPVGIFALEGLTQLMKTIDRIKINLNSELKIKGILLTMYDKRNKLSGQVEKEARDYFKEKVYQTIVPRNVRLSEAPSYGVPVLMYDKNCPGSKSYFSFTEEFINQEKILVSACLLYTSPSPRDRG